MVLGINTKDDKGNPKVLIVGAIGIGISGIAAALNIHESCIHFVSKDDVDFNEFEKENIFQMIDKDVFEISALPLLETPFIEKPKKSYQNKYAQRHHRKSKW